MGPAGSTSKRSANHTSARRRRDCEPEFGAMGRCAGGPKLSAMSLDDASANGEPHAHAGGLGCEQRVENAIPDGLVDSGSRILDTHKHSVGAIDVRPDAQDARPVSDGAYRIRAVHDEIHDDLLQLDSIAQCLWHRR